MDANNAFIQERAFMNSQNFHTNKEAGQSGFTLVELMITVAIIAILAAVAIPNYSAYVIRGKLVDATSGLADYRVRLEQYYQDNRNYGPAAGACVPAVPTSKYFTISCLVGATNQTYTATATSIVNQGLGAAGDYTYTLTELNARATTQFAGAAPSPVAPCWLTKKGDSC
jgi:type IV pilus assembly protein PilE